MNQERLIRNRISHRYKEPSNEELLAHITLNADIFYKTLKIAKGYVK